MGGILYAYELPPPEDIKPMTLDEERSVKNRSHVGLNDIQRGLTKGQ